MVVLLIKLKKNQRVEMMLRLARIDHNLDPVEFSYDGFNYFKNNSNDSDNENAPVALNTQYGVNNIQPHAFWGMSRLKYINVCYGVSKIKSWALCKCVNLTDVVLPNSLKTISKGVFSNCSKLKKIKIPSQISCLSEYLFYDCVALKDVDLSSKLKYIEDYAFYNCVSLTLVSLPNNLREISYGAFCNCLSLSSIFIPAYVKKIDDRAFSNCYHLLVVKLPDCLDDLGEDVFINCDNLKVIVIPDNPKFDTNNIPGGASNVIRLKQSDYELICGGKINLEKLDHIEIDLLNKILAFEYLNPEIEKDKIYRNKILKELNNFCYKDRARFCNVLNASDQIRVKFSKIYFYNKNSMPNIKEILLNNNDAINKYFKSFELDICKLNLVSKKSSFGSAISIFYNNSVNNHFAKYYNLIELFKGLESHSYYANSAAGNKRLKMQ